MNNVISRHKFLLFSLVSGLSHIITYKNSIFLVLDDISLYEYALPSLPSYQLMDICLFTFGAIMSNTPLCILCTFW